MPRGDLDTYRKLAAAARDLSPVAEMHWASAYAAPLLRLLESRSFVVSIWGDSLGGKSAQQALAASAWGRPSKLKRTGDMSKAAAGVLFSSLNDSLVWVDDTQQAQRDELLESLIYLAGNGTSSSRATQFGTGRAVSTWNCVVLVSGERPMLGRGAAAGAQNRAIEVYAPPLPRKATERLHRELEEHHGHTGPLFIEELLHRFVRPGELHALREVYRYIETQLDSTHDATSAHVALLVTADMLARAYVWNEDEDHAEERALRFGGELLRMVRSEKRDVGTPFEEQYANCGSWIAANAQGFEDHAPRRLGKRLSKGDDAQQIIAVLPTAFEEFCKLSSYNVRALVKWLKERGLLLADGKDDKAKTQIGKDRPRCYRIIIDGMPEIDGSAS